MRFMITCRIPVEKANELAKTGRLDATIHSIMEELNPEAAYFSQQIAMTVRRVSLMHECLFGGFFAHCGYRALAQQL